MDKEIEGPRTGKEEDFERTRQGKYEEREKG